MPGNSIGSSTLTLPNPGCMPGAHPSGRSVRRRGILVSDRTLHARRSSLYNGLGNPTGAVVKVLANSVLALCVLAAFADAASAQQAGKLFFEGDMVKGPQPGQAGPFCVLQSQFFRKQQVAWRVRVLDADRKQVDDKGLKSLMVELSNGKTIELKFKPHPPRVTPTDFFW